MTTVDFIIALFYRIDNQMTNVPKHPQAVLHPSEVVTLGVLYALKGGSKRAFYRWLVWDWHTFFPRLPERTRLFRLWAAHPDWIDAFRAQSTTLGVIDSYGIELLHPAREGRAAQPLGKKGRSNHRWIIGDKLCVIVNQWGLIVDWECNTANVHDSVFHPMIRRFQQQMILLSDQGFHAKAGDPANLKVCPHKTTASSTEPKRGVHGIMLPSTFGCWQTVYGSFTGGDNKGIGNGLWTTSRSRCAMHKAVVRHHRRTERPNGDPRDRHRIRCGKKGQRTQKTSVS